MKLNIEPSLNKVKELSENYAFIPVYASCYADTETPISVFKRFEEQSSNCFLLDSVEGGEKWARYSFLAKDPLAIIRSENGCTKACFRNGTTEELEGSPIKAVKAFMTRFSSPELPELPRLYSGAVGYMGYDLIRYVENLPHAPHDDLNTPDLYMMIADEMVVFDHVQQKLTFVVCIPSNGEIEASYTDAIKRITSLYENALKSKATSENNSINEIFTRTTFDQNKDTNGSIEKAAEYAFEINSNMTREKYMDNVIKAKKHIFDGDIFQLVLSQRFSTKAPSNPFDVYRLLRLTNPSPYMYYIKFSDMTLVGASPELLLRCENGIIETCPIAGTRKRGQTASQDAMLENDLLNDEKEKSEHIMLVDLGRNDIGRVSEFGSVKVSRMMEIVRFSEVMHLSSTVTGKLKKELHPLDALMSVFPAGTLSGAPKVRAMELIDTFEPTRRGVYGGAIGYLSFDGHFDSCITIRTILIKDGKAYVQAGAGIVADSEPEKEYEECQNKAMAMLFAIREAGKKL